MKKFTLNAESSTRIYKNWIIEANDQKEAILLFAEKVNKEVNQLRKIKCEEIKCIIDTL